MGSSWWCWGAAWWADAQRSAGQAVCCRGAESWSTGAESLVVQCTGDHWRQSKAKLELATGNMKILETIKESLSVEPYTACG